MDRFSTAVGATGLESTLILLFYCGIMLVFFKKLLFLGKHSPKHFIESRIFHYPMDHVRIFPWHYVKLHFIYLKTKMVLWKRSLHLFSCFFVLAIYQRKPILRENGHWHLLTIQGLTGQYPRIFITRQIQQVIMCPLQPAQQSFLWWYLVMGSWSRRLLTNGLLIHL